VAGILAQPPFAAARWGQGAFGALKSAFQRGKIDAGDPATADELVARLDNATDVGSRLAQQAREAEDVAPLANAASICRWELMVLRERVLETDVPPRLERTRAELVRLLDGTAAAARTMSAGYRFHSLDRICDGGEALDDHLTALGRLRSRLAVAS
jgi:hypothetical protein